jgi:hypothetical protein
MMPVHIGELNTKVTVIDGDLPLTPRQIEALVTIVIGRLDELKRAEAERQGDRALRRSVIPGSGGGRP